MSNMEGIKHHFEEEAQQFDNIIRNLIPYYEQMVAAVVNTIHFESSTEIEVLDLGCGTGTVARAVKDAYPESKMTCLDIAENMLRMARTKMGDALDTTYINKDFYNFDFDKGYDVIVSSLALHHLVTVEDKFEFYKKIYATLNEGGIFVNADVVLASTDTLQSRYMEQWKSFMCGNVNKDEVENKWIPKYYEEDRPASMMEHIGMLKDAGFSAVDVVWKYYNFAVYMGMK